MRNGRFVVGPSLASTALTSKHADTTLMANSFIEALRPLLYFRIIFSSNFKHEPPFSYYPPVEADLSLSRVDVNFSGLARGRTRE